MPVEMRKILDKFFLPCFYGLCILGVVVAAFLFMNVKTKKTIDLHKRNVMIWLIESQFTSLKCIKSEGDFL